MKSKSGRHAFHIGLLFLFLTLIACGGSGDDAPSAIPADTSAPSVPSSISTGSISSTRVSLSWPVSTDNSGAVAGYKIYRDGTYITSVAINSFTNTNLAYNTTYRYRISAYDSAGNESAQSSEIAITTEPTFTKQLGTAAHDAPSVIAVDGNGNIYIAGYTDGNLDGQINSGSNDMFLIKYNSAGVKQWTRLLGTTVSDSAKDIAIDSSNNIYITGYTAGDLDGQISAGNSDVFIIKYDSAGNKIWTKLLGSDGNDFGQGLAMDSSGSIYVAGYTAGNLDGQINSGGTDLFISKFDSSGNVLWTRLLGNVMSDVAYGIALDNAGNIYATGQTFGDLDGNISAGSYDIVITKYDSSGNKQWTRLAGTAADDIGRAILLDNFGNVYITGETYGNLDGQVNSGGPDIFLMKFDSSGNKIWTKLSGTAEIDSAYSIAIDSSSNIYISGRTMGDLDGNTNSGNLDIFLSKYDSSGNKAWTKTIGTVASDYAYSLAVFEDNIYITGLTDGDLDGNTNAGGHDIFILKYDTNGNKQ